ncbi:unnamed protein product [Prunus brigantina]
MPGIDPKIICHRLHVNPARRLMAQKRRNFALERVSIIEVEIDKLLTAGFIEEVFCSKWLATIILVRNILLQSLPFRLKNVGATNRGLVNKIFKGAYWQDYRGLCRGHANQSSLRIISHQEPCRTLQPTPKVPHECRPFFKALKKGQRDKWDPECEIAFQNLKTYLTSPPLLLKPILEFAPLAEEEKMVNKFKKSLRADETSSADPDMPKDMWQLCVEGASNHKEVGSSLIIITPDETLLKKVVTLGFLASNNEVEEKSEASKIKQKVARYYMKDNKLVRRSYFGPHVTCINYSQTLKVLYNIHNN